MFLDWGKKVPGPGLQELKSLCYNSDTQASGSRKLVSLKNSDKLFEDLRSPLNASKKKKKGVISLTIVSSILISEMVFFVTDGWGYKQNVAS